MLLGWYYLVARPHHWREVIYAKRHQIPRHTTQASKTNQTLASRGASSFSNSALQCCWKAVLYTHCRPSGAWHNALLSLLLQLMVLICGAALGTLFKLFCMCATDASSVRSQPMVPTCIVQSACVLSILCANCVMQQVSTGMLLQPVVPSPKAFIGHLELFYRYTLVHGATPFAPETAPP